MSWNGKVAVVTGASSGIGRAIAIVFAKEGYAVGLAARSADALTETYLECISHGVPALRVPTDVTDRSQCANLINQVLDKWGKIDVLVNNAGQSMRANFEDVDLEVLHRLMDVNFWGAVYCTKYALPTLLANRGSVVGISSIAGYKGLPGRTGYSASKFALNGFLETLRIENLKKGLHVLVCAPGFTATNIRYTALNASGNSQSESPRDEASMMTSEEVAQHIYEAVKARKAELILTRQGKLTVLLNKFFPRWIDKKVYAHMAKEGEA